MPSIADTLRSNGLECEAWFCPCPTALYDWVCLNDASPLTRPVPHPSVRNSRTLPGGQLSDWEWSRNPDHLDESRLWRGCIPLPDNPIALGPHAWIYAFDGPLSEVVQDPLSSPALLLFSVQRNMRATCELVAGLQSAVLETYQISRWKAPPAPSTDWISRPHGLARMLLDHRWASRWEILDILGFVLHSLLSDPTWRSKTWPSDFVPNVERFKLLTSLKRGVIVDPDTISQEAIVDMVRHRIPVHYPWPRDPPSEPMHYLDPYTFPTHRFDVWERAGGSADLSAKSTVLVCCV